MQTAMNLAINNKENLIGSKVANKPLRSCLKRAPLIDLTNLSVKPSPPKSKRVTFNFDPTTPVLNVRKMSEVFEEIRNMGDVTRRAYSRIQRMLTRTDGPRVLVSYQPGVTLKYIGYMLQYPWDFNVVDDDHGSIPWQQLDPSSLDSAKDDPLVYVVWRPDREQCLHIHKQFGSFHRAVALVLGDVDLMVKLGHEMRVDGLLPGFDRPLTFVVTEHDMARQGPYYRETSEHRALLNATGGIPLLLEEFETEEHPEYRWIRDNKVYGRLFVLMLMNHPIEPHWRELKTGLSMLDLAAACGFTFSTRSGAELNVSVLSNSASRTASVLILCEKLKRMYCLMNEKMNHLIRPPGVAWQVMENIVVQNMRIVDKNLPRQTYKSRYPFLATSFLADKLHQVKLAILGPKITTAVPAVSNNYRTLYTADAPAQLHPEDWRYYLSAAPENTVIQPREASHSPDAYIIVEQHDVVDGVQHLVRHLLCFQVKYGAQDLPLCQVLDELAKCPQVTITDRSKGKRTLDYDEQFIGYESMPATYTLTFVYAAMNHDKVVKQLLADKTYDEIHESYIRITCKSFASIPSNVELIVLRRLGLVQLLGGDFYSYLKSFKPATTISSSLSQVYDNPAVAFLQCQESEDADEVLDEIKRLCRSYKKFSIDTSGLKLIRRPQATSSGANSETSIAEANVSPIGHGPRPRSQGSGSSIHSLNSAITSEEAQPAKVLPLPVPVVRSAVAGSDSTAVKPKLKPAPVKRTLLAPAKKYANVRPRYMDALNKKEVNHEPKEEPYAKSSKSNTNRDNNAPI